MEVLVPCWKALGREGGGLKWLTQAGTVTQRCWGSEKPFPGGQAAPDLPCAHREVAAGKMGSAALASPVVPLPQIVVSLQRVLFAND